MAMNWLLLKNSLLVSGGSTALAVAFGFAAALWLSGLKLRWRNRFLGVAVIALALPPFLICNAWLHFLGLTGVWRSWLPFDISSLNGTVLILSLMLWPITLMMLLGAWRQLELNQLEADPALTGVAFIRWLLWPMGKPALGLATVLTFVLALNNFAVPAILQIKVFPAELWVSFNTTFSYREALKISWPLVIAPFVLLLCFGRQKISWPSLEGQVRAAIFRRQLGGCVFFVSGVIALLASALSVGLPLAQLLSTQRTWTELASAWAAGISACGHSFVFAAGAATFVVTLGVFTQRLRIGIALWLPFFLPGILLGIVLIYALNRPALAALYKSIGVVLLAFTVRYLAVGWNGVGSALRGVDRDLADAARLSG